MARHNKLGVQNDFFQELREGSKVKQKIVTEYFVAYNRVMTAGHLKVGYADLFAGPGVYTNSTGGTQKSIPVMVCEEVIRNDKFRARIHLWFNEGDAENYRTLDHTIHSLHDIDTLGFAPTVHNKVVDPSWSRKLEKVRVPTLFFLDPCGYKGLSLNLVATILKGFGNDCIFFFNYSRINMKLDLDTMNESIDAFFEADRAAWLRKQLANKSPEEREELILSTVSSALEEVGAIVCPFRFRSNSGRVSHHLIYASKNQKAAGMMKRILSSASSDIADGVGSSEHDPRPHNGQRSLFGGLSEIEERLLTNFAGLEIEFENLLKEEVKTKYTESNYRNALLNLEERGRITVDPPSEKRRYQAGGLKRVFPKTVRIRFGG